MNDPTYALLWPRPLFEWEARRILELPSGDPEWVSKVSHLLLEAYEDEEVASAFLAAIPPDNAYTRTWLPQSDALARAWLTDLLKDHSRLRPYKAPVYWAERNGAANALAADKPYETFAEDFFELITELEEVGYFPKVLKKNCVDDPLDLDEVRKTIRRATKLDVKWPMTPGDIFGLSDGAVYSLVEYFHDQAQRPRTATIHSYGDCGLHYQNWNSQSGQSVYRWRLNALLENHRVPLRLGSSGEEQGRLIRHFNSPLDDLASSEITKRADAPEDEVAHAVRKFRARDASIAEKRAAIVMLYGEMEPKRKAIGRKLSSGDESDLFRIANTFNLRHRDKSQKSDYGEEFLDWVFWTNLSTLRLLDELARRQNAAATVSKEASA
ncbi:hypothetical protein [Arthrobacter sp. B6]|uniref:hypothetical protein n=1 Tax=Arthrobacter sp. B6 TaxID=1570137 RepID=UPI00082D90FD|nr:hypothetical protein [Arthrobacter sp. B6]